MCARRSMAVSDDESDDTCSSVERHNFDDERSSQTQSFEDDTSGQQQQEAERTSEDRRTPESPIGALFDFILRLPPSNSRQAMVLICLWAIASLLVSILQFHM